MDWRASRVLLGACSGWWRCRRAKEHFVGDPGLSSEQTPTTFLLAQEGLGPPMGNDKLLADLLHALQQHPARSRPSRLAKRRFTRSFPAPLSTTMIRLPRVERRCTSAIEDSVYRAITGRAGVDTGKGWDL